MVHLEVHGSDAEKLKNQYLKNNSNASMATVTADVTKSEKKSKLDVIVTEYDSKRTIWEFGDETNIDTTKAEFKNITYVNNALSYTDSGKQGFLYVYDKYIKDDIDLYLKNDAEKKLFEMLDDDITTEHVTDIMKFLLYAYDGIDRGVTDLDKEFGILDMSLTTYYNISGKAFGCTMSREEFIAKAEAYGDSILSGLAGSIYDICAKYNVNPCVTYGFTALESGWGSSATEDHNLFQMGSNNGSTSGFVYTSYEDSIEDFCKWVVRAADPSTEAYKKNLERTQLFATVNGKFNGTPENNIYALFSMYSWVGYTHTPSARACIQNTCNFLYGGVNECNHSDDDDTTPKEQADYMQYQIDLRLKIAEDVFGGNYIVTESGTYTENSSIATNGGDGAEGGTYISTSGRQFEEWIQGTGAISDAKLFDGSTMGSAGCGVYACGTLASSTGIEPTIGEVYLAYKACGNCAYLETIQYLLDQFGVDAEAKQDNIHDTDLVLDILNSGHGIMVYVGPKYNELYTSKYHWITLSDIRPTEMGSEMGYDIYALTSKKSGHGWQPIETVLKNLMAGQFYWIDDGQ